MNKILLVLSCNLHWAPYYTRYENIMKNLSVPYDLIIWNREGLDENTYGTKIEYNVYDKANDGSWKKIFKFIGFSRFVKKQIIKHRYEKIVFVGTYAGMPAFISGFLKKFYKKRYWIDLRDITYEHLSLFYKCEEQAILNSYKTVVSSKGYTLYLPKFEYEFMHNIDPSMEDIIKEYHKTKSDKIRISYIGNLGFWNSCKEMIDNLANDERFVMNFVGPNFERIQEYCNKNNIENVNFHGRFERSETVKFYNETDIIFNIYGNDTINVKTALSNKLYYSMRFGIPILVSPDTFMEKITHKYNIGFTFDGKTDFGDRLFEWYQSTDLLQSSFEQAWKDVEHEDKQAEDAYIKFIGG